MNKHQTSAYVIFTARRSNSGAFMGMSATKLVQNKPGLRQDQVAVRVSVTLPETAFTQPVYAASLDVPEYAVIEREVEIEALEAPSVEER